MENTFGMNIIPENDSQRIEALKRYQILDTPPENSFDNVARLATQIFKVPISLVSLVDAEQVYFKANIGMGRARTTSRGVSLCSLAVMQPEVTVFENAADEPCLLTNPNVAGDFGLKCYAGAPLTTHDGFLIGTLCIIDKTPRTFSDSDREILQSLAKIIMDEIELRLSSIKETEKQQLYLIEQEKNHKVIEELNVKIELAYEEALASNEELTTTNIELQQIQEDLLSAYIKLRESEEVKEIAIEQAQLGLWYIDAETREFVPSDRLKEFFGYEADEEMLYDAAIIQIREDYREKVAGAVELAIQSGSSYDLEYPIVSPRNQKLRWVRATGKLNAAENGRKSYFSGTVMDITEQKEDDQRKNDFISMVSHELKTPLTSMNGYIQMLSVKARRNEDAYAVSLLDKANRQTKKMGTMINGFLNMKRLETGKIHIDKQRFDMAGLIAEAEEESTATIASHNIIFAPVKSCFISADRDKIGQVITNLISNAVKYSAPASTIEVACVSMGQTFQVNIKDQGIGVGEADRSKLFSRFYRVESADTETINGFGIGLYLCSEIIARHDGKIWVNSELGKGSVFSFSLPVSG
ncbi:PAS domain S-box-containing protein [Pedobacter westerhofensis]|uniref:histidine kinase n=1 Tax=Pedobacter westerhofensis TaxID=425512 RepID=A0A521CV18_9SPHI|nr:ATP-binding protein [Pedobacter westerhofensis]SMO63286.1 PAS domain S-box-containing protein [Pedobacter westerhofensis]